jgi:hypothetical protein
LKGSLATSVRTPADASIGNTTCGPPCA